MSGLCHPGLPPAKGNRAEVCIRSGRHGESILCLTQRWERILSWRPYAVKNDSVLLDTGAWKRPLIGISGEELTRFGLDFLVEVNSHIHERPGSGGCGGRRRQCGCERGCHGKAPGVCQRSRRIRLESREQMPAGRRR